MTLSCLSTICKYTHGAGRVCVSEHKHAHTHLDRSFFLTAFLSIRGVERKVKEAGERKLEPLCFPTVSALTRSHQSPSQSARHFYNKNWLPLRSPLSNSADTLGKLRVTSLGVDVAGSEKRRLRTQSSHAGKIFIPSS